LHVIYAAENRLSDISEQVAAARGFVAGKKRAIGDVVKKQAQWLVLSR
jgi:hypothetical protein